jgi:RNA polymerase sigma factor (TIGR02999 family)
MDKPRKERTGSGRQAQPSARIGVRTGMFREASALEHPETSHPGEVSDTAEHVEHLSAEELFPLVYDEMRRMAARIMSPENPGHTLQPTALVHEAYLKLVDQTRTDWQGRTHFLAVGARIMRRLLINHARDRAAIKRGRNWERVELTAALARPGRELFGLDQLIAMNDAIERLAAHDERQAAVVTLRFFGGLTVDQIATVLGVSNRTVDYDWRHARAWLFKDLTGDSDS